MQSRFTMMRHSPQSQWKDSNVGIISHFELLTPHLPRVPRCKSLFFLDDKVAMISVKKVLGDNRAIMASVTLGPVLNIFAVDSSLKSSGLHCLNLSDPSKRRFPGNKVLNFKTMLLYETTERHFPQFSFYSEFIIAQQI